MGENDRNAFHLAALAGCATPDKLDSPGARFLLGVADAVAEHLETGAIADVYDDAHEIADGCLPVYTHDVWQQFIDLAAYQEDDDTGAMAEAAGDGDMTKAAMVALYQIGQRLAVALLEEAAGR